MLYRRIEHRILIINASQNDCPTKPIETMLKPIKLMCTIEQCACVCVCVCFDHCYRKFIVPLVYFRLLQIHSRVTGLVEWLYFNQTKHSKWTTLTGLFAEIHLIWSRKNILFDFEFVLSINANIKRSTSSMEKCRKRLLWHKHTNDGSISTTMNWTDGFLVFNLCNKLNVQQTTNTTSGSTDHE